ncbi:hypothetical protein EfmAA610_12210 [Enterococcus faecium]|nr:hypothetical protein EfmAA610_12210 [Enterococcus faecium]
MDKDLEKIVGLQTDKPLKQAFMPFGGINMANNALKSNGYTPNDELTHIFTDWRKTHNQGVFHLLIACKSIGLRSYANEKEIYYWWDCRCISMSNWLHRHAVRK